MYKIHNITRVTTEARYVVPTFSLLSEQIACRIIGQAGRAGFTRTND